VVFKEDAEFLLLRFGEGQTYERCRCASEGSQFAAELSSIVIIERRP
jgi:hypothetical protein